MAGQAKTWSHLAKAKDPVEVQQPVQFVPFNEIMSEQLALEMNYGIQVPSEPKAEQPTREELANFLKEAGLTEESLGELDQSAKNDTCSNDEMLARMLQREFDLQHDRLVKKEEKQFNANSKVKLSFSNQRLLQDQDLTQSDLEDDDPYHEYGEESKHWDYFEENEKNGVKIGRSGFTIINGQVTTKHDINRNNAKNACKVMEFESDINTGDGGGFPMKLNNNVYNALKVHSISEGKRMARLHEKKEKSTAEKAVDEKSRILLFKLLNNGSLDSINGVIATGKESVVIHGKGENLEKSIPMCEVAIKVFKTTITEFHNRIQYIIGDPILQQTGKLSKQNPKLTIPLWAEKEMHNLNRMRKFGIACPEVLYLKKHILVMSFIGEDGRPAPTLKAVAGSEEVFKKIWDKTVELMVKLYKDCQLIHADLSEYNLLWYRNKLWCIDVSQAVRDTHPMAFRFLWRDCVNICKYFSRKLSDVLSPNELFALITDKEIQDVENGSTSVELLDKMENYEKNEQKLTTGVDENGEDCFDEMFEEGLKKKNVVTN